MSYFALGPCVLVPLVSLAKMSVAEGSVLAEGRSSQKSGYFTIRAEHVPSELRELLSTLLTATTPARFGSGWTHVAISLRVAEKSGELRELRATQKSVNVYPLSLGAQHWHCMGAVVQQDAAGKLTLLTARYPRLGYGDSDLLRQIQVRILHSTAHLHAFHSTACTCSCPRPLLHSHAVHALRNLQAHETVMVSELLHSSPPSGDGSCEIECTVSTSSTIKDGQLQKWDSLTILPPGGVCVPCNDGTITATFSRVKTESLVGAKDGGRANRLMHLTVKGLPCPPGDWILNMLARPGQRPLLQLLPAEDMSGCWVLHDCSTLRDVLLKHRQEQQGEHQWAQQQEQPQQPPGQGGSDQQQQQQPCAQLDVSYVCSF